MVAILIPKFWRLLYQTISSGINEPVMMEINFWMKAKQKRHYQTAQING